MKRRMPESFIYLFVWLMFLVVPLITNNISVEGGFKKIFYDWLNLIPFIIVFLLNNFLLLRRFLFRGNAWLYASGLIVTALIVSFTFFKINPVIHKNDPDVIEARLLHDPQYGREEMRPGIAADMPAGSAAGPELFRPEENKFMTERSRAVNNGNSILVFINTLVISLLVAGFNTAIAVTNRWTDEEQARKEIEKEHVESKLAFLQNQVNPHFLMNTLNNIHSLIEVDSQMARESLIKLSSMMRYLLYESGRGTTTLQRELEFLRSYLELMELRVEKSVRIELNLPERFDNVILPPLLFISFIENAFKHGVSYMEPSSLKFSLIQYPGTIEFHSENTIPGMVPERPANYQGGFGLENIRKRLDMLYGSRYNLMIEKRDNKFIVNLSIPV